MPSARSRTAAIDAGIHTLRHEPLGWYSFPLLLILGLLAWLFLRHQD